MASPSKDLPTSVPPPTSTATSPAVDVSAHHSCHRCARRISRLALNMTSLPSVFIVGMLAVQLMLSALSATVGH